jgi:hypothetical protein
MDSHTSFDRIADFKFPKEKYMDMKSTTDDKEWVVLGKMLTNEYINNSPFFELYKKSLKPNQKFGLIADSSDSNFSKIIINYRNKIASVIIRNQTFEDISIFENVVEFQAISCKNITDISKLKNVRKITLKHCDNITNIESLTNVEELTVECCDKIKWDNIPANIKSLKIVRYNDEPIDCKGLRDVPFLTLDGLCPVLNLEKLHNEHVELIMCCEIYDFSGLRNVKNITIDLCNNFTNVSQLSHVEHLTLKYCSNVKTITNLNKVRYLELVNCCDIKTIESCEALEELVIVNCIELGKYDSDKTNFMALKNVKKINLTRTYVTNEQLSYFSNADSMCLCDCPSITDISSVINVPEITIIDCNNITNTHLLTNHKNANVMNNIDEWKDEHSSTWIVLITILVMVLITMLINNMCSNYMKENSIKYVPFETYFSELVFHPVNSEL